MEMSRIENVGSFFLPETPCPDKCFQAPAMSDSSVLSRPLTEATGSESSGDVGANSGEDRSIDNSV